MTILLTFLSFALAEAFHASGIIAVFVAALAYGYKPNTKKHNKEIYEGIWDYIEYIANSILFFALGAAFISQSNTDFMNIVFIMSSLAILFLARAVALGILLPILRLE